MTVRMSRLFQSIVVSLSGCSRYGFVSVDEVYYGESSWTLQVKHVEIGHRSVADLFLQTIEEDSLNRKRKLAEEEKLVAESTAESLKQIEFRKYMQVFNSKSHS